MDFTWFQWILETLFWTVIFRTLDIEVLFPRQSTSGSKIPFNVLLGKSESAHFSWFGFYKAEVYFTQNNIGELQSHPRILTTYKIV